MHVRSLIGRIAALTLSVVAAAAPAAAQVYPAAPVRIICGFAPGGPTDVAARAAAKWLSERLKQPFVVETRAGANGLIGVQALSQAKPDGYTLMAVTSGMMTITPAVKKALPYDPEKDFTPIAIIGGFPYVMVTRKDFPANDVDGAIAYARQHPGKVVYGSAGIGSTNHLAGEWFARLAGLSLVHVPYKGDSPALADLVGGSLDIYFMTPGNALPQVRSGKLKALGVAARQPSSVVQGIDALIARSVPGYAVGSWIGIVGPAGLPEPIVRQLNAAIADALKDPTALAELAALAQEPISVTPDQFAATVSTELGRWKTIAREARIEID